MALSLVFIGLSISSSWGNGHATTYRALLRALAQRGHRITFLERDQPWYADNRDLPRPEFCRLRFYSSVDELKTQHAETIARADAVIVGSYVADCPEVLDYVLAKAGGIVAFYDIDTPVTLARLDAGDHAFLAPELIPLLDIYFSFAGGRALERLRDDYGARLVLPLWCMVDQSLYAPSGADRRWDLGYLGTYSPDRQPGLERLLLEPARRLPHRRFVVAGPQYPDSICWPDNVDRIHHIPPSEHAAFYGSLRHALNLTRADMAACGWSPSVRLFEAAACGAPIISDRWDGIGHFFPPGQALLIADHSQDVEAALEADDGPARERARQARAIVLSHHTGWHRAAEFEVGLERARRGWRRVARERNYGMAVRG